MSENKPEQKEMSSEGTATGCLQKGDEPNGFTLTGEDGKVWELRSSEVSLSEHVGHKVTITGSPLRLIAAPRRKSLVARPKKPVEKSTAI
jgi:hypothetical protein